MNERPAINCSLPFAASPLGRKLQGLKSVLIGNGYFQRTKDARRGTYWQLRYTTVDEDGKRHRRGLYVGSDERLRFAKEWLDRLRIRARSLQLRRREQTPRIRRQGRPSRFRVW